MTPSLEWWPTKVTEAPSPYEVRLAPLDTNSVFWIVSAQSAGAHGYCISEKVSLNCLWIFQFEYFISLIVFQYNNLTAVSKLQVSNYTLFLKSQFFLLCWIILHYFEYLTLLMRFIFDFWTIIFFNGIRNMKHGRRFHFAGICISKFIYFTVFKGFFFFFSTLNSKSSSFKRFLGLL